MFTVSDIIFLLVVVTTLIWTYTLISGAEDNNTTVTEEFILTIVMGIIDCMSWNNIFLWILMIATFITLIPFAIIIFVWNLFGCMCLWVYNRTTDFRKEWFILEQDDDGE